MQSHLLLQVANPEKTPAAAASWSTQPRRPRTHSIVNCCCWMSVAIVVCWFIPTPHSPLSHHVAVVGPAGVKHVLALAVALEVQRAAAQQLPGVIVAHDDVLGPPALLRHLRGVADTVCCVGGKPEPCSVAASLPAAAVLLVAGCVHAALTGRLREGVAHGVCHAGLSGNCAADFSPALVLLSSWGHGALHAGSSCCCCCHSLLSRWLPVR